MLKFLGNGSAFNNRRDNNSAYFKHDKTLVLIDAGSTVFKNALNKNIFADVSEVFIAITHLHMDHCGSIGQIIMYLYYKMNIRPTVIFPQTDIINILDSSGITRDMYNIVITDDKYIIHNHDNEMITLKIMKSSHVDTIDSYSFLFNYLDKYRFYYSGDAKSIPETVLSDFKNKTIDVIYQDTCGVTNQGNAHLNIEDLCLLIPKEYRNKVYCMHLDQTLEDKYIEDKGFNVAKVV
ncbi:MAG: MBL fold metallo-hydrolase [Pseudobutyrivibrio sp.]|nr:MBL fold metallo-hydrolase [Pseudobutyrivibrio sp.]